MSRTINLYRNYFLAASVLVFGFFIALTFVAFAQNAEDKVIFPVAELGNCADKQACKIYCDRPDNISICVDFAVSHGLITEREADRAHKFVAAGAVGPGGCRNENACEAFCENLNNINVCLAYAEKHGFMDERELAEARRVALALKSGATLPGGCRNERECEIYCSDIGHIEECLTFGEAAGLMDKDELNEARQVAQALQKGAKLPGGCTSKDSCDVYCSASENINECLDFAEAAGLIAPEELEEARRIAPLMARGEMPGGCRSRESCEVYCEDETHFNTCADFAIKAGFMTSEEAEQFKKTGGKGPGGCKGQLECEAFCNTPTNQQICFDFAREHGLIQEEELKQIEKGVNQIKSILQEAPSEVTQCIEANVGPGILLQIQNGNFIPGQDIGEILHICFERFFQENQPSQDKYQEEFIGPNGCSGEDCKEFCDNPNNRQVCEEFFGGSSSTFPQPNLHSEDESSAPELDFNESTIPGQNFEQVPNEIQDIPQTTQPFPTNKDFQISPEHHSPPIQQPIINTPFETLQQSPGNIFNALLRFMGIK